MVCFSRLQIQSKVKNVLATNSLSQRFRNQLELQKSDKIESMFFAVDEARKLIQSLRCIWSKKQQLDKQQQLGESWSCSRHFNISTILPNSANRFFCWSSLSVLGKTIKVSLVPFDAPELKWGLITIPMKWAVHKPFCKYILNR